MKKKKLIVACITVFLMTFMCTIGISAYNYWHLGLQSIPTNIYLASYMSYNERSRCQDAMATWNTSCFTYDALDYAGTTNTASYPMEDTKNVVTKVTTVEGYLAQTNCTVVDYTFLWINFYLVEFDININPSYSWYADSSESGITDPVYSGYYDLETVVLHEFGHVLGLDHSSSEYYTDYYGVQQRNVMYAYLASQSAYRDLSDDDILGVVNLY